MTTALLARRYVYALIARKGLCGNELASKDVCVKKSRIPLKNGLVRYEPEWSASRVTLEFFSVGPSV